MFEFYLRAFTMILIALQLTPDTAAIDQTDYLLDFLSYQVQANATVDRRHCDMTICESIVTKCTKNQRCSCDFKRSARCAKDCLDCLEEKFGKCCACVDLCPPLGTESRHSSHVGTIKNYDEQLFYTLTETDDVHGRWTVDTTGPTSKEFRHPEHGRVELAYDGNNEIVLSQKEPAPGRYPDDIERPLDSVKCVVAFINRQLDMSQCKRYCNSMGASAYRWFQEGCCECVGKFCIHYGSDRPKCRIVD